MVHSCYNWTGHLYSVFPLKHKLQFWWSLALNWCTNLKETAPFASRQCLSPSQFLSPNFPSLADCCLCLILLAVLINSKIGNGNVKHRFTCYKQDRSWTICCILYIYTTTITPKKQNSRKLVKYYKKVILNYKKWMR